MSAADAEIRSVFDCNVLLQAMASAAGPAAACLDHVRGGRIELFLTRAMLGELLDVASRPVLVRKLALTPAVVESFVDDLLACSTWMESVPSVYTHPVDSKDSIYVDAAVAFCANVITTRDRHLLALRDPGDRIGLDFMSRFPSIDVLTPNQLLEQIRRV